MGQEKKKKNLKYNSRSPGLDINPGPPEYERESTIQPQRWVNFPSLIHSLTSNKNKYLKRQLKQGKTSAFSHLLYKADVLNICRII
jgi:hypothetical protein